jgi:hypothetical protein
MSALAPFRPPGWGSVGCRTFVELNLSGALDARHHLGDGVNVSGGLCQLLGTPLRASQACQQASAMGRSFCVLKKEVQYAGTGLAPLTLYNNKPTS